MRRRLANGRREHEQQRGGITCDKPDSVGVGTGVLRSNHALDERRDKQIYKNDGKNAADRGKHVSAAEKPRKDGH